MGSPGRSGSPIGSSTVVVGRLLSLIAVTARAMVATLRVRVRRKRLSAAILLPSRQAACVEPPPAREPSVPNAFAVSRRQLGVGALETLLLILTRLLGADFALLCRVRSTSQAER
jgi:hypothetical protein